MGMKYQKGSFTIEAAILVPFILFLMMTVVEHGIELYQQSVERESLPALEEWDAVGYFYEIEGLKELEEEIKND